jgi:hypothetical protein
VLVPVADDATVGDLVDRFGSAVCVEGWLRPVSNAPPGTEIGVDAIQACGPADGPAVAATVTSEGPVDVVVEIVVEGQVIGRSAEVAVPAGAPADVLVDLTAPEGTGAIAVVRSPDGDELATAPVRPAERMCG